MNKLLLRLLDVFDLASKGFYSGFSRISVLRLSQCQKKWFPLKKSKFFIPTGL